MLPLFFWRTHPPPVSDGRGFCFYCSTDRQPRACADLGLAIASIKKPWIECSGGPIRRLYRGRPIYFRAGIALVAR
jgi:hypothetical protein